MSTHVSVRYGVPCPTCSAAADQPCRTLKSRRVTDTHMARMDAAYPTTPTPPTAHATTEPAARVAADEEQR